MPRILITEPKYYSKRAIEILKKVGEVILLENPKEFNKLLKDIDVLVIKLNFRIEKKIIDKALKLKLIATSTTGLDYIDVDYAQKKGIKIISLKNERNFLKTIHSTAEETIGLLLALVRKLPWAFELIKQGQWNRERYYGYELFNKTIGILGFGRIGEMVSFYCKSLGLKVISYDPYIDNDYIKKRGVTPVSFEALFQQSDFVSIHVPLTPETVNLIGEKEFKLMKPTAFLINTSRGQIVNEEALFKALKNKVIAGAALDVMSNEQPDGSHLLNNKLIEYAKNNENLIILPHLGGATFEAMAMTEEFIARKIKDYLFKKA